MHESDPYVRHAIQYSISHIKKSQIDKCCHLKLYLFIYSDTGGAVSSGVNSRIKTGTG